MTSGRFHTAQTQDFGGQSRFERLRMSAAPTVNGGPATRPELRAGESRRELGLRDVDGTIVGALRLSCVDLKPTWN